MPGINPSISVIIPVYNGNSTLKACLDALYRSDFQEFETIIIDDGSSEGPHNIAEQYPCQIVVQENAGPGPARNRGASMARGQILFFLDADIMVRRDSLSRIAAAFAANPDAGALFGSFGKETSPDNFATVYKNLVHHYTHQTAEENAATFCGGFGAIRREVFEAIGGFHPPHRFLEDVEIGYRLHQAGHRILLLKDLQFTHLKSYTIASLIRSDLYGRAIPWTRLILSMRLFRNDLNTRTHNVLSVPCSLLLTVTAFVEPLLTAGLVLFFIHLNRAFLRFLAREKGLFFALRAAPMLWLGYLYSALGVGIGTWLHLTSPLQPFAKQRMNPAPDQS